MSGKNLPLGYGIQAFTFEFLVSGALDGITIPPTGYVTPSQANDPQNIYRFEIEGDLGCIDPDFIVPAGLVPRKFGSDGNRGLMWISIALGGGVAAPPGARVIVVDNVNGTPQLQKQILDLEGLASLYYETPELIPQGSMLCIEGVPAPPPGTVHKIRFYLLPVTNENVIDFLKAHCSCSSGPTPPPPSADWTVSEILTIADDGYVASNKELVLYNPGIQSPFTIVAPANPNEGDRFRVKNVTAQTDVMTIDGNGNKIETADPIQPLTNPFDDTGTMSGILRSVEWQFAPRNFGPFDNAWVIVNDYVNTIPQ